jgi:hypothetical protein
MKGLGVMVTECESINACEASSIEVRCCHDCGDPIFVLLDEDGEPMCFIGLSRENTLDLLATVQRALDGMHGQTN